MKYLSHQHSNLVKDIVSLRLIESGEISSETHLDEEGYECELVAVPISVGNEPSKAKLYWGEIEEDDEITPEQRAEVVAKFKYWVNNSLGLPFNGETFNEYTIRSLVAKAKEMGKVVLFDKNGDIAGIPFFNKR